MIDDYAALDIVCLCHEALSSKAEHPPTYYIERLYELLLPHLTNEQRVEVDEYIRKQDYSQANI